MATAVPSTQTLLPPDAPTPASGFLLAWRAPKSGSVLGRAGSFTPDSWPVPGGPEQAGSDSAAGLRSPFVDSMRLKLGEGRLP
jgi:hypothetical protein